ncbi:WD40 repeat-like protein [Trichoderma austrokoningii]
MDVLGLLSNISQVVDLLVKIGVMCSIYCFDVKNAPKEVRLLLREVDRLTVVIKELENLLHGSKGAAKIESPVLRQTVFDLRKLLAELVAKLDLGAKNTSTRAIWPFKKREIHNILATIDRQKANIVLNMSIEQTSILIDVHQEFVLSKLRIAEAATFDSSVDGEQSYCLPGTRTEVIAQIQQWSTEQNGQSIFWLNGMAGTGKSTISRTVAQLLNNNDVLGASFFFKRGEGNRGRATLLFTTIAAQLIRRLPNLAPHIREVLDIDPLIHEKPLDDQFQRLILDPLRKNPRCWGPSLLIVIDALDECGSEDDMRTLISVFSMAQHTTNPRVKFFLTSRPELPIRLGFENIGGKYDDLLLASVPATTIALDIELFMRDKLRTIKTDYNMSVSEHRKIVSDWPGEEVFQKLIATAIPLFIAAVTICRFLSDRRLGNPHHQLNRLLEYQTVKISGMEMTYLPVLDRLIAGLSIRRKQEVLHRFRYLIGSIITLVRPLSIKSLSHLLGVSTDVIEDQLDLLHSVLSVPTDLDTPVRLLHLSFRDFLVDAEETHSKTGFWVDERESHSKLFTQCLELLSHHLKEDICCLQYPGTLQSEISQTIIDDCLPAEIRYACMHWAYHKKLSNRKICDDDETHNFLAKYLLNWLEALSILKQSAESVYMIDDLLDILEENDSQEVGNLLRDARRFILANLDTMNTAPLQLYSSALIFAPTKSIVREIFDKNVPLWVTTRPKMQSNWDPCLATFNTRYSRGAQILFFPTNDRFLFLNWKEIEIWDTRTISCIGVYDAVLSKSITFSPDGNDLFYLTGRETLQVVSAATRSCVAEFRGHTDEITSAMFSQDGQQLASSSKDGSLKIWDRRSGRCTATHQFDHGDKMIGFSPDGASFLIISEKALDFLDSRATDRKLTYRNLGQSFYRAAVFSYESNILVSFESQHTIRFTDVSTGISLTGEGVEYFSESRVFFFSGGHRLVCAMADYPGRPRDIGIWNTLTATCDILLKGHRAPIIYIILSKDEKRIASASADKSIRVWDAHNGSCVATYHGHGEKIMSIGYSTDGNLLVSVDDQGISKVWDTNPEIQLQNVDSHESAVLEVVLSPDKKRVVTTAGDGTIKLWDTVTGECITTDEHQVPYNEVPLVVPLDLRSAPYDYVMELHDLYAWPRSILFSPDSSIFFPTEAPLTSDSIKLWNANTGGYELVRETGSDSTTFSAIPPDGTAVLSTFREGAAMYWDIMTKKLLRSFDAETHDMSYAAFSPDGTYVMFGYEHGAVRLYHLLTGKWKDMSEAHDRRVFLIAMSADNTRLVSCGVKGFIIWETDTCACIAKPEWAPPDDPRLRQILFSPDSQYLFVLYTTGNVKVGVFCVSTGHLVAQLEVCGLANHMEFASTGSSQLITNVGTLAFDPPTFHTRQVGIGLSNDAKWITWDSRNWLRLPPTMFRISASDIDAAASVIALGSRTGRLLLIGIDGSKIPPPTATVNLSDAKNVP